MSGVGKRSSSLASSSCSSPKTYFEVFREFMPTELVNAEVLERIWDARLVVGIEYLLDLGVVLVMC